MEKLTPNLAQMSIEDLPPSIQDLKNGKCQVDCLRFIKSSHDNSERWGIFRAF